MMIIFRFFLALKNLNPYLINDLKLHSKHLETYIKHDSSYDLDGQIVSKELKVIRNILTIKLKSNFIILKLFEKYLVIFPMNA